MPQKRRSSSGESIQLRLGKLFLLAVIWGGVAAAVLLVWYAYDLPDVRQIAQWQRRPSITMLADDGTVFARYGDLYGDRVTLDDVPDYLPEAVISIEDRRFYHHFGIDVMGLMRAAFRDVTAGHVVQGGSTITQQLAKNLFLTPDRTIRRKVQEMMLALWLEHTYTKDQILTAYLNRVYLGAGTYGVDAASRIPISANPHVISICTKPPFWPGCCVRHRGLRQATTPSRRPNARIRCSMRWSRPGSSPSARRQRR